VLTERRPANLQIKVANGVQRVVIRRRQASARQLSRAKSPSAQSLRPYASRGACGTVSRRTRYFGVRPALTGGVGSYCHSSGAIGLSFSYRSTPEEGDRPGLPVASHESGKLRAVMTVLFAVAPLRPRPAWSGRATKRPRRRAAGCSPSPTARAATPPSMRATLTAMLVSDWRAGPHRRLPRVPAPRRSAPPEHREARHRQLHRRCRLARAGAPTAPGL